MTETNNGKEIQIKDAQNQKIEGLSEEELLIELSKNPGKIRTRSPELGEHNFEILSGLGYSKNEIEQLKIDRII